MIPSEKRVLVVDDESALRTMLERGLSRAGLTIRTAADARQALDVLHHWSPHLIVLDVMLPEIDGVALLPRLRETTDVPIIMLSARSSVADKVLGLERGADDYVAKPFELEELVARIHTALRRPRLDVHYTLTHADLTVDIRQRMVFRGARRIDLSKREFALLLTFLKDPGTIFTRTQLLDLVWGADRDVAPNVVETYISYLRAKIDQSEPVKLIQTIRGVGYMLNAEEP